MVKPMRVCGWEMIRVVLLSVLIVTVLLLAYASHTPPGLHASDLSMIQQRVLFGARQEINK
jgi:hypothetical protein